jgi:hypothetical protein
LLLLLLPKSSLLLLLPKSSLLLLLLLLLPKTSLLIEQLARFERVPAVTVLLSRTLLAVGALVGVPDAAAPSRPLLLCTTCPGLLCRSLLLRGCSFCGFSSCAGCPGLAQGCQQRVAACCAGPTASESLLHS